MGEILLQEKVVLEYIKDMIINFKIKNINVNNAKFHHNTRYKSAPLILKHGILPIIETNRLGITNYTKKQLEIFNDTESHINGIEQVSLSIPNLKDLYVEEREYNPFSPYSIDFLVSSDIKASRTTIHYGNEYLHKGIITPDKIKSVDIRLFELTELVRTTDDLKDIIENYNMLKYIALTIKKEGLDIPLREMSNENLTMDIEKVIEAPKIILKKSK